MEYTMEADSNLDGEPKIRPFLRPWVRYNCMLGIVLIFIFGIPRFILVMGANVTRNYGLVSIVFLAMWLVPFILLDKKGRRSIGIKKPANYLWLLYSIGLGALLSVATYLAFYLAFGHTIENGYVYISGSTAFSNGGLTPDLRLTYFLIYAFTSMTFSPIGEELLYRGVIHGSFVSRFGENRASLIDSLAFAFTHLAHFGIVYIASDWHFLPLPSLLWVVCMFVVSRVFFVCKVRSGSLLGAMFSHAAYNVAMGYIIFYWIYA